jgi:hypothetical protein
VTLQSALPVDAAILAPPAERLTLPPKHYAEEAPKQDERSVRHDRIDKPTFVSARSQIDRLRNSPSLHSPRRNELAKPVSPHILIDSDSHE